MPKKVLYLIGKMCYTVEKSKGEFKRCCVIITKMMKWVS